MIRSVATILLSFVLACATLALVLGGTLCLRPITPTPGQSVEASAIEFPANSMPADPTSKDTRSRAMAVEAQLRKGRSRVSADSQSTGVDPLAPVPFAPLRVQLVAAPSAPATPQPELVVTLFAGTSGAPLAQQTITNALPQTIVFPHTQQRALTVTVATRDANARNHYLAKTRWQPGTTTSPKLAIGIHSLQVQLAGSHIADIPVLLRRQGDPRWRWAGGASLTDAKGKIAFHGLGAGNYQLSMQGFTPAPSERSRLQFDVSAFDATRPIRGQ